MNELVFPDSFWVYVGFQIPSAQVAELRVAINDRPRHGYGGWLRNEWDPFSYLIERQDGSSIVKIYTDGTPMVQFADDDKCVGICTLTGRITRLTRAHLSRRRFVEVRVLLLRAMTRFRARKQRRVAMTKALDELGLLILDLYPLVASYVGAV